MTVPAALMMEMKVNTKGDTKSFIFLYFVRDFKKISHFYFFYVYKTVQSGFGSQTLSYTHLIKEKGEPSGLPMFYANEDNLENPQPQHGETGQHGERVNKKNQDNSGSPIEVIFLMIFFNFYTIKKLYYIRINIAIFLTKKSLLLENSYILI